MNWNEPGGQNRDPWGKKRDAGPPDLDEVLRKFQDRLSSIFGGKGGNNSGGGSGAKLSKGLALIIILLVWGLSGIYIVDEGERGVVLQFGNLADTTQPGPHWYPPLIQTVEKVNVTGVRSADGSAQVLTGDENIVQVTYTIQYNIKSAADYLFNVNEPDLTLRQASESAFREIIGKNTLDYVIQDGREEVPVSVKSLLQENLDLYGTGIDVITVNLIDAQPPQEVQEAFDDAIKAREDKDRYIKQAEVYSNEIIPKARGNAQQQIEQARAYEFSVIKSAEGEADRFVKLLSEYKKAPRVTRDRLYLDAIESVLASGGKVLLDVEQGSPLLYLPLDKLMSEQRGQVRIEAVAPNGLTESSRSSSGSGSLRNSRSRGDR